jgi:selenophosphate synthetase-related protein
LARDKEKIKTYKIFFKILMLKKLADSIRANKNIKKKQKLNPIVQYIDSNCFKSSRIFTDLGEDSAAIRDSDTYILITTDRIITSFVENYPFGAGFSSILVSVDDIYACGGTPLGASIILSFKEKKVGQKILEGICFGSKKFEVPIIRGHTNAYGACYELSSTMIGEIKKEAYISAGDAQVGDSIILAVDFDGKIGEASKFFFDTTTFKSSEIVLKRRRAMNLIAQKQLAHASKDISNGGLFGSILQLIKYSKVGADINVTKIKIPPTLVKEDYNLVMFSQMYLTSSFILTAQGQKCKEIVKIFKEHGLEAMVIGKIIEEKNLLRLNNGKKSIEVMRF